VEGPPAYVAAHRIAVTDERLPFEQAYCLARLVIEHGGGPLVPERTGTMSWRVFKPLAADDLVLVTSEFSDALSPAVEVTISALFVEELGYAPPAKVRINGFIPSHRRTDRYVEVTQRGAELVANAVRSAVGHRAVAARGHLRHGGSHDRRRFHPPPSVRIASQPVTSH